MKIYQHSEFTKRLLHGLVCFFAIMYLLGLVLVFIGSIPQVRADDSLSGVSQPLSHSFPGRYDDNYHPTYSPSTIRSLEDRINLLNEQLNRALTINSDHRGPPRSVSSRVADTRPVFSPRPLIISPTLTLSSTPTPSPTKQHISGFTRFINFIIFLIYWFFPHHDDMALFLVSFISCLGCVTWLYWKNITAKVSRMTVFLILGISIYIMTQLGLTYLSTFVVSTMPSCPFTPPNSSEVIVQKSFWWTIPVMIAVSTRALEVFVTPKAAKGLSSSSLSPIATPQPSGVDHQSPFPIRTDKKVNENDKVLFVSLWDRYDSKKEHNLLKGCF